MNLPVFEKGQIKDRQEGRQEVHLEILHKQLAKKLGLLPNGAVERLKQLPSEELEAISLALVDATFLEELGLASE